MTFEELEILESAKRLTAERAEARQAAAAQSVADAMAAVKQYSAGHSQKAELVSANEEFMAAYKAAAEAREAVKISADNAAAAWRLAIA